MRKSLLLGLSLLVGAVAPGYAVTSMQLFMDANGVASCTLTVDTALGGTVTPSGSCGTLAWTLTSGPHGRLEVNGSLGNFSTSTTIALGQGAVVLPEAMDLATTEVTSKKGAGTFTTRLVDLSHTFPAASFDAALSFTNLSDAADHITFTGLYSGANAVVPGTVLGVVDFNGKKATKGSGSSVATWANPSPGSIPYSLGTLTVVKFSTTGTVNTGFTLNANVVPEPASIVLLGSMLLVAGIGLRRRKLSRG